MITPDQIIGPVYFSDSALPENASQIKCPKCGTSLLDLYKDGRMGCMMCYDVFKTQAHRALVVLHGAYLHVGKDPSSR